MLRGWSNANPTLGAAAPLDPTPPPAIHLVEARDKLHTPASSSTSTSTSTASISPQHALEDALRREMTKRNGSPDRVREIVRDQMRFKLRDDLRLPAWRFVLNVHPLLPRPDPASSKAIYATTRDLANQRVIEVDVERTRVDVRGFRTPRTHSGLVALLTHFCSKRNVRYRQGLNEILAPFVWLHRSRSASSFLTPQTDPFVSDDLLSLDMEAGVLETWSAFMDKYIPHFYAGDDELYALQAAFRIFELLLAFHDPELKRLLDAADLRPELYAQPWFMTLFAQSLPLEQLLQLWDLIVFGNEAHGEDAVDTVALLALALVCGNRTAFLKADASDLPVLLTSRLSYHRRIPANQRTLRPGVAFAIGAATANSNNPTNAQQQTTRDSSSREDDESNGSGSASGAGRRSSGGIDEQAGGGRDGIMLLSDVLDHAIAASCALRARTPRTLARDVRRVFLDPSRPPDAPLVGALEAKVCLSMSSEEFVERGVRGEEAFVVVDTRPRSEFASRRVVPVKGKVINWNVEVTSDRSALGKAITEFSEAKAWASPPDSNASTRHAMFGAPSLRSREAVFVCVLGEDGHLSDPATHTALETLHRACIVGVCLIEGGFEGVLAVLAGREEWRSFVVELEPPKPVVWVRSNQSRSNSFDASSSTSSRRNGVDSVDISPPQPNGKRFSSYSQHTSIENQLASSRHATSDSSFSHQNQHHNNANAVGGGGKRSSGQAPSVDGQQFATVTVNRTRRIIGGG